MRAWLRLYGCLVVAALVTAMSEVELYRTPLPDEIPVEVRGDWLRIGRMVRVYAKSKLCPKEYRDDPEAIFAALWMAHSLGMAVNISVLKKFHNFDGVEPSAQTRLGLMHAAGHHTRWGRHDDTLAELFVRQAGELEEERFSFTVEQAERAHLLDEWVEQWVKFTRDDGKVGNRLDKYVLGSTTDEYRPEWVQPLVDQGKVHRREAWFAWREDMLMNRAATRASRFATPEVELGIERALEIPPPPTIRSEVVGAPLPAGSIAPSPARPEVAEPQMFDPDDPTRPFE